MHDVTGGQLLVDQSELNTELIYGTMFAPTQKNRIFLRVKIRYLLLVETSVYNTASYISFFVRVSEINRLVQR